MLSTHSGLYTSKGVDLLGQRFFCFLQSSSLLQRAPSVLQKVIGPPCTVKVWLRGNGASAGLQFGGNLLEKKDCAFVGWPRINHIARRNVAAN